MSTPKPAPTPKQKPEQKPEQKPKPAPKQKPITSELSNELKTLFTDVQKELTPTTLSNDKAPADNPSADVIDEHIFYQGLGTTRADQIYIKTIENNEKDIIVGNVSVSFLSVLLEKIKKNKKFKKELIEKCFYHRYNSYSIISFIIHYISVIKYVNRDTALKILKKIVKYVKEYKKAKTDTTIKFKENNNNVIPVWEKENINTYSELLDKLLKKSNTINSSDGKFNDKTIEQLKKYLYVSEKGTQKKQAPKDTGTPKAPGAPTTTGTPNDTEASKDQENPTNPQQSKAPGASTSVLSNIILRF